MKKIISLALAATMVAGMSVASFAKTTDISTEPYIDENSAIFYKNGLEGAMEDYKGQKLAAGDTIAVLVENQDEIDDSDMHKYKAFGHWELGGSKIAKVELKKYKYTTENGSDATTAYKGKKAIIKNADIFTAGRFDPDNKLMEDYLKDGSHGIDNAEYYVYYVDNNSGNTSNTANIKFNYNLSGSVEASGMEFAIVIANKRDLTQYVAITDSVFGGSTGTGNIGLANPVKEALKKSAKQQVIDEAKYTKDDAVAAKKDYAWFAVATLTGDDWKENEDIVGKLTIAKTNASAKDNYDSEDHSTTINFFNLNYNYHERYLCNGEVEEFEFENAGQQALLVIDTTNKEGQYFDGCFRTTNDNDVWDEEIFHEYEGYELFFYNWIHTPVFNRTGDLFFYSDDAKFTEDWFVYEIRRDADGNVELIPLNAIFDEVEDTLKIRTRQLKSYVVSEKELVIEDVVVDEPTDDTPVEEIPAPSKPNPETGR